MIRFIDLGDQILEDTKKFAWFDTMTNIFEKFNYSQTWDSWEEFEIDYNVEKRSLEIVDMPLRPIERYGGLFKWKE